jgi:spermidine synthase
MYLMTLLIALSSMVYELLLAQTLSAVLGSTWLRYNITIGLYLASLGIGAWLLQFKIKPAEAGMRKLLFRIELSLAILGSAAPVICLWMDFILRSLLDPQGAAFNLSLQIGAHLLIVWIGILSGLELPLLIGLGNEVREGSQTRILAFDYFGTFLGAVLFPFVLLPRFGLFGTGFLSGALNCFAALMLYSMAKRKHLSKRDLVWGVATAVGLLILLISRDQVQEVMTERIYLSVPMTRVSVNSLF